MPLFRIQTREAQDIINKNLAKYFLLKKQKIDVSVELIEASHKTTTEYRVLFVHFFVNKSKHLCAIVVIPTMLVNTNRELQYICECVIEKINEEIDFEPLEPEESELKQSSLF